MKELLLVDDVKLYLQLTKSMVSRKDYIIHTAVNGHQAIEIAKSRKPDLILLDLHMPGMDGDIVCSEIRKHPLTERIPVIMVTVDTSGEARRRCLSAGCDDFITRPVGIDALNEAVEKQFSAHERAYPRMDVILPCLLNNGDDQLLTNIYTLSAGGAYVETDTPPLPGSNHLLTFFLPESLDDISVKALARWNRLDRGGRPAGSGFEFVEMEEKYHQRLNSWARTAQDDPVFC